MTSLSTAPELEILISTMNRVSLDFLLPMFPQHFSNYQILVINQTSYDKILVSELTNIRVLNIFETGLSKSRNEAIINAIAKVSLLADDDIVYKANFDQKILNAFKESDHEVITFNHQRTGQTAPNNQSGKPFIHNNKTVKDVCSIEIAFLTSEIKKNNIFFNEDFGLGAHFETSEELLFLREILENNISAGFDPTVIVEHPLLSTGKNQGGDKQVFAWTALSYKTRGILTYILLPKFLFYLISNNFMSKKEYFYKLKIGLSAIRKYKLLQKLKQ